MVAEVLEHRRGARWAWFSALLRNTEFHLVPNLVPWSRRQVEQGLVCQRKNARGVDLNRNYDYQFNRHPNLHLRLPTSDQYPGPRPFSEPESRAVRDEATRFRPDLYINVHSGAREMYTGWDHKPDLIPTASDVLPLLDFLNASYCGCPFDGAGKIGGYVVFGSSMDYLYARVGVPFALTFEVYGGQAMARDCFPFFNPTDRGNYTATVRTFAHILLAAPAYLLERRLRKTFPLPSAVGDDVSAAMLCAADPHSILCDAADVGTGAARKDAVVETLRRPLLTSSIDMNSPAYSLLLVLPTLVAVGLWATRRFSALRREGTKRRT